MRTTQRRNLSAVAVAAALALGLFAVSAAGDTAPGVATVDAVSTPSSVAAATDDGDDVEPVGDGPAAAPTLDTAPETSVVTTEVSEPSNERDPWLRPFSSTSIWNTPIGSSAAYVPADLPYTERHLLEHTTLMRTDPADPLRSIIRVGSWTDRCSGTEDSGRALHLPDGWKPRSVTETATPNNPGVFLQPDGRTLVNLGAMGRCNGSGPLFAEWPDDADKHTTDIYGDGQFGAHGGSNLNQFGGAIRPGELDGDEPIRHALDLLIWSEHLNWGGSAEASYRWPATTSDSYAGPSRDRGDNPELRMGSLLALPTRHQPRRSGHRDPCRTPAVPGAARLRRLRDRRLCVGCHVPRCRRDHDRHLLVGQRRTSRHGRPGDQPGCDREQRPRLDRRGR